MACLMGSKDFYLWGCLFALIRDQFTAINKQAKGDFGYWGRTRAAARDKEIQKFLLQLYVRGARLNPDLPVKKLLSDFEQILQDKHMRLEVTPQQADYVLNILLLMG